MATSVVAAIKLLAELPIYGTYLPILQD